jgi:hypothetical protein
MFDAKTLKQVCDGTAEWSEKVKGGAGGAQEPRRFSTVSDLEIKPLYTPDDTKDLDFA